MPRDLLAIKEWNSETNGRFFDQISGFDENEQCYLCAETAGELMKRKSSNNLRSAEVLLLYAEKHFPNAGKKAMGLVLYRLGRLYESKFNNCEKACHYYEKYSLCDDGAEGKASLLVRSLLLRDHFAYSEELEKQLRRSWGEADLDLRETRLYETLAHYIIAKANGKNDLCQKLAKQMKGIVKADEVFVLDLFCRGDDVRDVLEVPKEVIAFVKAL